MDIPDKPVNRDEYPGTTARPPALSDEQLGKIFNDAWNSHAGCYNRQAIARAILAASREPAPE